MTKLLPNASPCTDPVVQENLRPLADLLIRLEAEHHQIGWDNSPVMLYTVTQTDEKDPKSLEVNAAKLGRHRHPREELERMALSMVMINSGQVEVPPDQLENFKGIYDGHIVGHALVMETWICIPGETTTDMHAMETRPPSEIPGSLEGRFAFLVGEGDLMVVGRVRGEEPQFSCFELGSEVTFGGEMVHFLLIYDAAVKDMADRLKEVQA